MSATYDDGQRADQMVRAAKGAQTYLGIVRDGVSGGRFWEDPMPQADEVCAEVETALAALARAVELLHGDLSEQAERWLAEPGSRTTLSEAAQSAGVGGVIRRYYGGPTELAKQYLDYEVLRINGCSVRVRDLGTRDEKRITFAAGWNDPPAWVAVAG